MLYGNWIGSHSPVLGKKLLDGRVTAESYGRAGTESPESCQPIRKRQNEGESPELSNKVRHWDSQDRYEPEKTKERKHHPKSHTAISSFMGDGSRGLRAGPTKC